ncbi:organic hydroperoxide resistance protein [Pseudomonas sp. B21-028]|jgi:Ohr subfamily peroxiredoxin|uniref:organic hydroperoxide resistance protein n=1 Tax=Pseudomonas sp. B21-028 TaxID=2895480 RepID=UPI00215EA93E|nr:organic hydroperoxide resistance protein [Pseudomonas sp. B21-028]UVL86404.1 organic hydroperoxide resistance protein [Pseudomonas sp. B21-028]
MPASTRSDNVLYTAHVDTTGGRDGHSRSDDGRLDVQLSSPGSSRAGTNPEQLFAAGWSACFEGAMQLAARRLKIKLPENPSIDAQVDLCLAEGSYFLQARLKVSVPGVDRESAQALLDAAHETCPYSKLSRNNIYVEITLA